MATSKWLNWRPETAEFAPRHQECTDRTDKTSVLSVLSVQPSPQAENIGSRILDSQKQRDGNRSDLMADNGGDGVTTEAVEDLARLLAIAYQRYSNIKRVGVDSVNKELALPRQGSVHGLG